MLNHWYGVRLGLEEVLYVYTIKRHNVGKYYFVANANSLQLVNNLPDTSKNKPQGNVMIFGAWGCLIDPMLLEFRLNLDPGLGRTPRCFLIHVVLHLRCSSSSLFLLWFSW